MPSPARLLTWLCRFSLRHPRPVLAAAVATALLALLASALGLGLKTSNLDLVSEKLPEVAAFRAFAQEFGSPNPLVVVLEGRDPQALEAAVERLEPRLAATPGVAGVLGRPPRPPAASLLPTWPRLLTSRDGGLAFLFVEPEDEQSRVETIAPLIAGVRHAIATAKLGELGVEAGLTGLPAYALDDRDVIAHDLTRLSALSFLLVAVLFAAAFASWRRPLLVMTALLWSTATLFGFATLWPGHLTLLSSFFGSIVFGMGVDFGILLIDRFEEKLAQGESPEGALEAAVTALAPGLATGALTTALGFFALAATGFRGFAELGVLAGLGILLSLFAMVTVLPALLVVVPQRRGREKKLGERRIGKLLLTLERPWLAALLLGVALAAPFLGLPHFDSDYLNLEPTGSEAVRLEREMVARSELSPQFAAFTRPSAESAAALVGKLRAEPTVASVHSAAELETLLAWGADPQELESLKRRFVSEAGRHAVYAYPRGNVWDPEVRDRFLSHMRALDRDVTGMPFLGRFLIELSKKSLLIAGALSLLLLVICVSIDLRQPVLVLLALVPTVGGLLLLSLLMRLFGLAFNPLSVMALPIVIGLGEDNAVHLLHRLLEEKGDLARTLAGTGRALVLTSGTTIASFLALSFASHQGLATFAQTLALGVASTLLFSLFVVPRLASAWLRRA